MSKDYMTDGLATWITFPRLADAVRDHSNPWETAYNTRETLYAPVDDQGGLALFRRQFTMDGLVSARIDATALGVYELFCNGHRVGRTDEDGDTVYDEMKPGWTDYNDRVLYASYDLAPYLVEGENTLVAAVAPGWYNGRINCRTYGEETHVAFLAAIHLVDADGARILCTDADWKGAWGGAIRASEIWDGEFYDANLPTAAELSTGCNCVEWGGVLTEEHDLFVTPQVGPTVTVRKGLDRTPESIVIYDGTEDNGTEFGRIRVVRRSEGENGFVLRRGEAAVIDLGQNMVGRPVFTVFGEKGTALLVRFGEMLNDSGSLSRGNDNPEGSIYAVNYRTAKSKINYILAGKADGETYTPLFTFFGFRYLEITATDNVTVENLSCRVIGSATREIGHMETSHPDVNRLISNVLWGQRGNYFSVPTDCPQRDERLGWTGDTQAFCGTAAYNADVAGFFHKWLQDARDSQNDAGMYPDVIPTVKVVGFGGAAWSDAGIVVPYVIWKMYGDTAIIEEHFASMERYMDWLATTDHLGPNPTYGDWLAYEPTDNRFISVAYYALDAMYMATMARAIGRDDRAAHYAALYEEERDYFRATYCDEAGDLKPEHRSQCGYLLALRMDLLKEENRPAAVAALKQKIVDNGYKLSTGFVGSCILNEILAENGENNLAYSLLLQTENPSWLYSVHQGATTIWERWNSYTKATGFGDVGMNSFNHYAYGAVQEWMYRHIAGIETTEDAPGFAHPILQPKPDTRTPDEMPAGQEKITWVKTSYESRAGLIVSNWSTENGFTYECAVPAESTLYLPILTDAETYTVNGITQRFDAAEKTPCGRAIVLTLAPGRYFFEQE